MSFLDNALDEIVKSGETAGVTVEVEAEAPVEVVDAVADPIVETVVAPVAVDVVKTPTKKDIDYKGWLDENQDSLKNYLNEKATDYSKLPQEELVRRKIKAENPEFDENDIEGELQDKYGIGLQRREIDEDTMDSDEIAEIKRENSEIDKLISKGKRELKKDGLVASKYFEEIKSNFQLPKFEIDEIVQEPTETFDPEQYHEQLVQAEQKDKEERWIPQLKSIIEPLESLKEKVEFEDNGNKVVLDIDYKLSKEEKEGILGELADYKSNPSDSKYIDDKGNADVERFLQDKSMQLMYKKLIKTASKEAYAMGRKEFVKTHLVNFDDGIRNRSHSNEDESDDAVGIWNTNKKYKNN